MWISADPIYDGVKEGLGVYTYCGNNPVIFHDPTGLESEKKTFKDCILNIANNIDNRIQKNVELREQATKEYWEKYDNAEWYGQLWMRLMGGNPSLTTGYPPAVGLAPNGTTSIGKLIATLFKNPTAVARLANIRRIRLINGIKNIPNQIKNIKNILKNIKGTAKLSQQVTDDFIEAANQPFKNGQFTVSGRALTKHPNIVGANDVQELYTLYGNQTGINQAANNAINNFIQNGTMTTKTHKVFGSVVDFKLPNGLGVRFSATTKEFIHFLGRGVR